jgi:hypothetical protein
LVAGWFSFEDGHATAGDLLACEVVCAWLDSLDCAYDIAYAPPFAGGVDWRAADPGAYSDILFVCGPFQKGDLEAAFLSRFAECRLIGIDLSMALALQEWNPFDLLLARDADGEANADIVFMAQPQRTPVIGVCLVEPHPEAQVERADALIQALLRGIDAAVVAIDTRLDVNATGLRTPAQIESAIARMDCLVTTRLHGLVLALKNGVPALVVDAVPGGGKLLLQARRIGWPAAFGIETAEPARLSEALSWCLMAEARRKAEECAAGARRQAEHLRDRFLASFSDPRALCESHGARTAPERLRSFQEDLASILGSKEATDRVQPPVPDRGRFTVLLSRALRRLRDKRAHSR